MKRTFLILVSICLTSTLSAQWLGTNPVYFNSGKVGIGTSSPIQKLQVHGNIYAVSGVFYSDNNYGLRNSINDYGIYPYSTYLQFRHNGSESMRIDSNGNVGIGTTSPNQRLTIAAVNQTEFAGANTSSTPSNLELLGTSSDKVPGKGPSLTFRLPANTDGTNSWAQARILGSPANTSDGDARGALYLQVRDFYDPLSNGTFWNWRTGLMINNNGNVGIGTTSPSNKLQIGSNPRGYNNNDFVVSNGNGSTAIHNDSDNTYLYTNKAISLRPNGSIALWAKENGFVGIGTNNPSNKLQIGSNPTGYNNNDFVVSNGNGSMAIHNDSDNTYLYTNRAIALRPGGSIALWAKENGFIGIGTTSPTEKLSVDGNILAKKVRVSVSLADWPDYVFTSSYELRALSEVENYIKENQHLPDVPAAKEVETNGLDLGAMDATLLKKVEELTLYLIQESKEKDDLKKENKELKKTLNEVLKRLDALEKK